MNKKYIKFRNKIPKKKKMEKTYNNTSNITYNNTYNGLYNSSISRNFVPGFAFYLKELNSLLELKVELGLQQRLDFIYLLYNLLDSTRGIEAFLVEGISNCLSRLLKYFS